MNKFIQYWGLIILMVGGVLLSGGCHHQSGLGDSRKTLRMAIWSGALVDHYQRLASEYEKIQPEWRISVELQSGQAYDTWLKIQMIGGTCPEVMNCQWADAWRYGRLGRLLDLNDAMSRPSPYADAATWRESYYAGRYESALDPLGRLFIVPIDQVKTGLFINEDILEQLDLSRPETWEEYTRMLIQMQASGYVPVAVANSQAGGDATVVWTTSSLFDNVMRPFFKDLDVIGQPDGRVNPEEFIRGVRLGIVDLRSERARAPWKLLKNWSTYWQRGFNAATIQDVQRLFFTGRAVMKTGGCWSVRDFNQRISELAETGAYPTFQLGIMPIPHITAETSPYFEPPLASVGTIGTGFVIPSELPPEREVAAIDWLQFITSPAVIESMSDELNLPAVQGVRLHPRYEGWEPLIDGTFPDLTLTEGCIILDPQMEDEWTQRFHAFLDDRITLDEFVEAFAAMFDRAAERSIARYEYDTALWELISPVTNQLEEVANGH